MGATRVDGLASPAPRLGAYLRDRRARLDPAALGLQAGRRRTPGLRREEVAARARISPTWYTWLEQGRGGAPSADVLDRIADALLLTGLEREHLFLLALGRPPGAHYQVRNDVSPRLQRVLDTLDPVPALIRTAIWDVVAWNRAATVMLVDYAALAARDRNVLRIVFLDLRMRATQHDWESVARFIVGSFRVDAARAGASAAVEPLARELCERSPEFARLWSETHVQNVPEHVKHIHHPVHGPLAFEHSAFVVDGRPDLCMVVYNPATPADAARIDVALGAGPATPPPAPGGLAR